MAKRKPFKPGFRPLTKEDSKIIQWCINNGILEVDFDLNNKVTFDSKKFSFTKDLK